MKITIEHILKKSYCSPQIERTELDNEISLALESTTPATEPEWSNAHQKLNNNSFKIDIV